MNKNKIKKAKDFWFAFRWIYEPEIHRNLSLMESNLWIEIKKNILYKYVLIKHTKKNNFSDKLFWSRYYKTNDTKIQKNSILNVKYDNEKNTLLMNNKINQIIL